MLELAMKRIKLPVGCRNLLINLFSNRKNRIIGHNGLTDPYDVLVGIDQGEVISPLLWCIYYDPLLTEIKENNTLGYKISHQWRPDLSKDNISHMKETIPSQAYMDDTTWITSSKAHLEKILNIADSFYMLNNIQVNLDKSILLTSVNTTDPTTDSKMVTLNYGTGTVNITPKEKTESIRFLGVWINLSFKKQFVKTQISNNVKYACNIMKFKRLTDTQMVYILNKVICLQIGYRMQLTIFSKEQCNQILAPFRKMFKAKLHFPISFPNSIIDCPESYNLMNLYSYQLQAQVSFLNQQLNNKSVLGRITRIRTLQLQTREWLSESPLKKWEVPYNHFKHKSNIIASTLCILKENEISISPSINYENKIKGGVTPLIQVLGIKYHSGKFYNVLRERQILFLSQLLSTDGTHLLKYSDLTYRSDIR